MTVQTSKFADVLSKIKQMSDFHPLEVVDRDSETQPQMVENLNKLSWQDTGG